MDSFGNSKLAPACADIKCGEMECVAPFTLKADGSCCGTCFAPDHVVALDRHFAIDSPYKMDTQCDGAP